MEPTDHAFPYAHEFSATPEEIRQALGQVRGVLRRAGADADMAGRVEQVLAEALNNVEEHAYAGGPPGPVRLSLFRQGDGYCAEIRDGGRAMPPGGLPGGTRPATDVPRQHLPEGGFGWYLIHQLSDSLMYRRENGENHLWLRFAPRSGV